RPLDDAADEDLQLLLGDAAVGGRGQQHGFDQRGVPVVARPDGELFGHGVGPYQSFGSIRWLARMFPIAASTLELTWGISTWRSSISFFIRFRRRFSCDPHRSHGMMGNRFSSANSAMSRSGA